MLVPSRQSVGKNGVKHKKYAEMKAEGESTTI